MAWNPMILMPQIFDVIANENARYKPNELEYNFDSYNEYKAIVNIPVQPNFIYCDLEHKKRIYHFLWVKCIKSDDDTLYILSLL